jgi:hypothetical protein
MTEIKELDLNDSTISNRASEELNKNGVVIINNFISSKDS